MKRATDFGAGIRILRQDKWEALCSFIISQCNNIPRIKKIVETLCSTFGDPVELNGKTFYTFPSADRVASLEAEDLAPLRCGYRAPYIIDAARAVASGELNLEELSRKDFNTALKTLKSLNGVGDKVANCVILFGLCMLNAFPIDVWMKKAIKEHYGDGFDPKIFGDYAGIAQQYMFYYARSGEEGEEEKVG
jgi:N-glycosylase/DNA lyase